MLEKKRALVPEIVEAMCGPEKVRGDRLGVIYEAASMESSYYVCQCAISIIIAIEQQNLRGENQLLPKLFKAVNKYYKDGPFKNPSLNWSKVVDIYQEALNNRVVNASVIIIFITISLCNDLEFMYSK
ncbi:MAG: hypothetical protein FWE01_01615 [Firmicutes bacterium]|nr:hypothetical protein [Bacillota bacterium]